MIDEIRDVLGWDRKHAIKARQWRAPKVSPGRSRPWHVRSRAQAAQLQLDHVGWSLGTVENPVAPDLRETMAADSTSQSASRKKCHSH
jgi:hypothetical protein